MSSKIPLEPSGLQDRYLAEKEKRRRQLQSKVAREAIVELEKSDQAKGRRSVEKGHCTKLYKSHMFV